MGACFPGSHAIFRSHNLHTELKELSWFELYLFGITGRRFSADQLELLQAIWTYTSYPDSRIWNNRVAALAGSTRSTGSLAVSGALAVSEASIYGHNVMIRAGTFFRSLKDRIEQGESIETCVVHELKTRRSLAGYGRPVASGDERIAPIPELAEKLGYADGPFLKIALSIDELLKNGRWRLRINYAAVSAALMSDMGLSPSELYQFVFPAFMAGMPPCYTEAREKPIGSTFPVACSDIRYLGVPKRPWNTEPAPA